MRFLCFWSATSSHAAFSAEKLQGIPWRSSSLDSVLPLQGAWVQSLVGQLSSHKPCDVVKKQKKSKEKISIQMNPHNSNLCCARANDMRSRKLSLAEKCLRFAR